MNDDIKVIGLYDKDGHLKKEILEKLKNGELCGDALIEALNHISECELCAKRYAESFEENELLSPPIGFQEEINSKIKEKSAEKNDFIPYVIKVVIAASIAIIITLTTSYQPRLYIDDTVSDVKSSSQQIINKISSSISDFTSNISFGGYLNEKTKK